MSCRTLLSVIFFAIVAGLLSPTYFAQAFAAPFQVTSAPTVVSGETALENFVIRVVSDPKEHKYPPAKNSRVKKILKSRRNCKGHVFEVNHYGKSGIELARENLNKYVAELQKKSPRKKIRVIEDEPRCYKFLDLILFDEWTCKIEAAICQ